MNKLIAILLSLVILCGCFCSCKNDQHQNCDKKETSSESVSDELTVRESFSTDDTENAENKTANTPCQSDAETSSFEKSQSTAQPKEKTEPSPYTKSENSEPPVCEQSEKVNPEVSHESETAASVEKEVVSVPEYSEMELTMLELINEQRALVGAPPLKLNHEFYPCAKIRAGEADILWSHTRPNGKKYFSVIHDLGLENSCCLVGENLGKNFKTVERVMQGLMDSEGHRKNILNTRYTDVALCIIQMTETPDYYVVAQIFIQKK